jgi:hypothetical protein
VIYRINFLKSINIPNLKKYKMKNLIAILICIAFTNAAIGQSDAKALEIIQKNMEVSGGKAKMAAVKSMIRTMEMSMPFGTSDVEAFYKNGKYYTKSMMNGQVGMEMKYDGIRLYMGGMAGNQTIDDESTIQKMIGTQAKIFPVLDLESNPTNLVYEGTAKINNKECHKIGVNDGTGAKMFFDASTGFLVRLAQKSEWQGTEIENNIEFGDYKMIDGLAFAHKMSLTNGQFSMDMKVKEIKLNPDISDKIFMIE